MDFDFYQQYKEYSNINLLKIVQRPEDFQPEAIAVAIQILNDRQVSAEELQLVDEYFQAIDKSANGKKGKSRTTKTQGS